MPCVFQSIMAIILLSFAHRMMLRNEVPSTLSANSDLGLQMLVSSRGGTQATSLQPWTLALKSLPYCLLFLLTKLFHKISEKVYVSSLLSLPSSLVIQNISSSHLPRFSFVYDRGAFFQYINHLYYGWENSNLNNYCSLNIKSRGWW